jgi:hypothetical protein
MAETPLDPPPPAEPARRDARAGPAATGESGEVLEKLEILLGRLRAPDSPREHPSRTGNVPTLDEPVHLTSPAANLHAIPAGRHIPTLSEPVELQGALVPIPVPIPVPVPAPAPPPPSVGADPDSVQALRRRIEALIDPDLEQRLCGRALADLERTLIDIERGWRDELAAWRDEHVSRMRDQVRGEIERAVDEVVAELARQQGPGSR